MVNSVSLSIVRILISGSEVMCSFSLASPNALDIASWPSTRGTLPIRQNFNSKQHTENPLKNIFADSFVAKGPGICTTNPPRLSTSSFSSSGSWSTVIGFAEPFLHITARESPTCATISFCPSISIAVTAVEPPLFPTFLAKISSSVALYALLIAPSGSSQKSDCPNYSQKQQMLSYFPAVLCWTSSNGFFLKPGLRCYQTDGSASTLWHRDRSGHQILQIVPACGCRHVVLR